MIILMFNNFIFFMVICGYVVGIIIIGIVLVNCFMNFLILFGWFFFEWIRMVLVFVVL